MNNWIPKNKIVKFAVATAALSILLYLAALLIVYNKINKIENFYASADSESFKEEKFWAIKTGIPISQFNKTIIRPKGNKPNKNKGTFKLRLYDKKLYEKLEDMLRLELNIFNHGA